MKLLIEEINLMKNQIKKRKTVSFFTSFVKTNRYFSVASRRGKKTD